MTENKRFKLKYINEQHISANLYDNKTFIGAIGIGEELIVELLNNLSDENELLKIRFNEEREKSLKFCRNIDTLTIENEQLKQRNTNQYQQLTELWEIIEEENWEKLIAMKKQLKEDEERLQQEWKCYE